MAKLSTFFWDYCTYLVGKISASNTFTNQGFLDGEKWRLFFFFWGGGNKNCTLKHWSKSAGKLPTVPSLETPNGVGWKEQEQRALDQTLEYLWHIQKKPYRDPNLPWRSIPIGTIV